MGFLPIKLVYHNFFNDFLMGLTIFFNVCTRDIVDVDLTKKRNKIWVNINIYNIGIYYIKYLWMWTKVEREYLSLEK